MSNQFHWAGSAHLLLRAAEVLGVSPQAVLDAAQLSMSDIPPSPGRISWPVLQRLTKAALALTGEPAVGLIGGLNSELQDQGIAAVYFMHMSPVRASQECAYHVVWPRTSSIVRFWHEESGDVALHCASIADSADPLMAVQMHVAFGMHVAAYRHLFGVDAPIDHLELQGTSIGDPAKVEAICGFPVRTGQARDALVVQRSLLDEHLPYADSWLLEQIRPRFEAFLRMLDEGRELTLALRSALVEKLASADVSSLAEAAKGLRIKPRTLQAKLAAEGTSFSKVLDELRKEFALRELSFPGAKIFAIGARAGFSDPAAFTRAFRRWTGSTPSRWQSLRIQRESMEDLGPREKTG